MTTGAWKKPCDCSHAKTFHKAKLLFIGRIGACSIKNCKCKGYSQGGKNMEEAEIEIMAKEIISTVLDHIEGKLEDEEKAIQEVKETIQAWID